MALFFEARLLLKAFISIQRSVSIYSIWCEHDCLKQTVFTIAIDAKNASFSYFHSFASHIRLFLNKLLEIKCGFTKNKHWSRSSCRLAHLCLFNHIHFISFGNVKLWVGAALKLFCSHWSPTARIITS